MNIKALHISTAVTAILIAILTIYSELDSGFKSLLAGTFGHHWVGKGIISLIVFVLLSLILNAVLKKDEDWAKITFIITILSGLAIFIFYVWHFFAG